MPYFTILILVSVILIFGVDWLTVLKQRWNRLHIGKWQDCAVWKEAVGNKCSFWLTHTPTIPIKDQNRLILWDIIRGRYRSSTIQSWQKAGLLLGLGNQVKFEQAFSIAERTISASSHIDSALMAYALLEVYPERADDVRPLMKTTLSLIMHTKGENDTVPYRKSLSNIRFVDTLGFICPFLMLYGKTYQNEDASQLALKQLAEYNQALLPEWGFPAHAYDIKKRAPLGLFDWGRGIGWYIIALLGVYKNSNSDDLQSEMEQRILALGDKLLLCQLPSGGYSHQLFNDKNPAEGSATVLITLLLQQCFILTNDTKYQEAINKCVKKLMHMTRRDGSLDGCQGDTKGIGYYSSRFDIMPFAQGLLLYLIKH